MGIGKLSTLRTLTVQNNKLEALPPELCECIALEEVDVSNNPLEGQHCGGVPPSIVRDVPGILWLMRRHLVRRPSHTIRLALSRRIYASSRICYALPRRHRAHILLPRQPPRPSNELPSDIIPLLHFAQEARDRIADLEDHNRRLEDREKDSVLHVQKLDEGIVEMKRKAEEEEEERKRKDKKCVIC